ncbi:MAG: hypothetical protein ABI696_10340 [Rubrivivax sp.]
MSGERIRMHLEQVEAERRRRQEDPELAAAVVAVKAYQETRFRATYADLLADPQHAPAALFFLNELYGPRDFGERDAQFARIVPTLVRLFPTDIVQTVAQLAELHALSEQLDSSMGAALREATMLPLDPDRYASAWRATARAVDRSRQIELLGNVGRSLANHTRSALLRQSLRLMRGPARAAGLGELQRFLELGFDTFRALRQPEAFLQLIEARETTLAAAMFDGGSGA